MPVFILNLRWNFWEVWLVLTFTAKFYFLCLLGSAVYMNYLLVRTTLEFRRMRTGRAATDAPSARSRLIQLNRRIETVRQFNTLLFFLFGIIFANEILATLRAIQLSAMSLSGARLDIFVPLTLFALLVFAILAFLLGFQWVVGASLQSKLASISVQEE
jgi:hypothetical protein